MKGISDIYINLWLFAILLFGALCIYLLIYFIIRQTQFNNNQYLSRLYVITKSKYKVLPCLFLIHE